MAATTLSTDQFLDVLRKSHLVEEKRLQTFLEASSTALPTNSRDLAQQLLRHGMLTQFQASQLLSGKFKGFMLAQGKYRLMERLGAGGMGQVFLCEHVRMKRLVALKVLPVDRLKDDPTAMERFDREARASAALDHPNIVRAHDIDSDGKLHFLVMEFVDGASLQDVVKKHGPLDIIRACHYIADAARGLQHAHEGGWVHRDVKPGNLLVDRSGTVKLLDMGLARLFADDTDNLTKKFEKNAVLGTADYLAPEQATNSSEVDIRADIYSLGATFYYLLTGRGPFDDGTVTQKLIWHQTRPPTPIRELRPDVPKELEVIINKMMAKKPVHRYQEPSAVEKALEPWTRQHIEPPADEEMPRLCPALENYSAAGASLPLSSIANSTTNIRRGRGGPRSSSGSRKSMVRPRPAASWHKNKWVLIGGGAAAIVVLGIGIAWMFSSPTKKDSVAKGGPTPPIGTPNVTPPPPPENLPKPAPSASNGELPPPITGRLLVAGGPNAAGRSDVFPTLSAALEKAAAGQTVVVLFPEIEGAVTLDARRAGVHLESGLPNGQMVLWKPRADASADVPLLRIESAGPVLIKGFTFDGALRLNSLVQVTGPSAGLRFEDCYLTDAGKKSILFTSANSAADQPVTLERVRFTTIRDYAAPMNQKSAAAIRPAAIDCNGSGTLNLNVKWCRFEGIFVQCILLQCAIDANIELNRFFMLKPGDRPDKTADFVHAVSVRNVPPAGPVHVSLISNTMAYYTHLLRIDKLAADTDFRFVVRNNLVLGSPADSWVFVNSQPTAALAKPFFEGSGGNVCRPGTVTFGKQLGAAIIPRKQIAFDLAEVANVAGDGFLRYKKTGDSAALMTAGIDGGPVGVPPLE